MKNIKKNKKEITFEDIWYGFLKVLLVGLRLFLSGLVLHFSYSVVKDMIGNGISVKTGIEGGITTVIIIVITIINTVNRMNSHGCTYGNWYQ